jgi:chromosome segregation ATPase
VKVNAEQLTRLQQLLLTKEEALSTAASQHQTTRTTLSELQARFDTTASELYSSRAECSRLNAELATSSSKCQELQTSLQQKEKDLAALHVELDNLEDIKCRGRELLTYQGEWHAQRGFLYRSCCHALE